MNETSLTHNLSGHTAKKTAEILNTKRLCNSPNEKSTGEVSSTGMFQKAILMAMVQRSRLMQHETLWARVNGLREGGSTMDTQMCSSLKPVDVLLWKIFLAEEKQKAIKTPIN